MPVIHAHRGASAYAPENTLPAFRLAIEMQADGIETDIHLTADKQYAVCHDDDIRRVSDGEGSVSAMRMDQLKTYDFGGKFSPAFAGTPIPTLDELLDVVGHMDPINIEFKGPLLEGEGLRETFAILIETLERHGCLERALISSFHHEWLQHLKEYDPRMRTGLLYGDKMTPEETLAMVRRRKADAIHPYIECIEAAHVDLCRQNGIDVNVWTVDSPEWIAKAIRMGVTGIITNVPDKVRAALAR